MSMAHFSLMRFPWIICFAILAGCDQQPRVEALKNARNEAAISGRDAAVHDSNSMAALPEQVPEISTTRAQLFDLPESNLRTNCAAADYYPDRRVSPRFYGRPLSPEFERYQECLLAEARRDGRRVRLASPRSFPTVGTCASARIVTIGTRFSEGSPDRLAGTSVDFDNGLYLVDYERVGPVARSRAGDRVRVCVYDLPKNCPSYDLRGIIYRARNLRTGEIWIMADTHHRCRGA
jgi:hypothetical protein